MTERTDEATSTFDSRERMKPNLSVLFSSFSSPHFHLGLLRCTRRQISCHSFEGIDAIQDALRAGELSSPAEAPVKIKIVAAPLYIMSTSSLQKSQGIGVLNTALDVVSEEITKRGGKFTIKTAVRPPCLYPPQQKPPQPNHTPNFFSSPPLKVRVQKTNYTSSPHPSFYLAQKPAKPTPSASLSRSSLLKTQRETNSATRLLPLSNTVFISDD